MSLHNRVERLERLTGIDVPCEVCALMDEQEARCEELRRRLGLPDRTSPLTVQTRCEWCRTPTTTLAVGFSVSECAMFERLSAMFDAGEICLPEHGELQAALAEVFERVKREGYGVHVAAFEKIHEEFKTALRAVKQEPRRPYLGRVPDCDCEYPKTAAEWQKNVRLNGYSTAA